MLLLPRLDSSVSFLREKREIAPEAQLEVALDSAEHTRSTEAALCAPCDPDIRDG